jgi:hypothetical protein
MKASSCARVLVTVLVVASAARKVTLFNDRPLRDVHGAYVDSHESVIVAHGGTYFLYGEAYGNQTLATPYPWHTWPRLSVYSSPDMVNWTPRGDPLPMVGGTLWIPNVVFDARHQRFVMWYGAGGWCSATSMDGVHFTPAVSHFTSHVRGPNGTAGRTDGTGIFVDDDGTGYVATATMPTGFDEPTAPGWPGHVAHNFGHIVMIERMSPDLLNSTQVNVTGFFPDDFVENPILFKRKGRYFLTYGSCCCGCTEGSGQAVFSAAAIGGPWVRQASHPDINCRDASKPICGGYSRRGEDADELVWAAQWSGISLIPLANGKTQQLYYGRQWLSGPNRPAGCFDSKSVACPRPFIMRALTFGAPFANPPFSPVSLRQQQAKGRR